MGALEGKHAVIYGAAGSVGSAVADAFAREGARLSLAGRTEEPLKLLAARLRTEHGAEVGWDPLDTLDDQAVDAHADAVEAARGPLDVSFNLTGTNVLVGTAFGDIAPQDFAAAVATSAYSTFATARAAGARMATRGSGVILTFTATPARQAANLAGAFGYVCAGTEGLTRTLAAELGPHGVRVLCIRSAGSPDSTGLRLAFEAQAETLGVTPNSILEGLEQEIPLRHMPRLREVASVAVFAASDASAAMTATVLNVTGGSTAD